MVTTSNITATEKFKTELERKFPEVFSEGLGMCSKGIAKAREFRGHFKVDHSEWVLPIVYVKKKNNKIYMCANFSTGFNDSLQN